MWGELPYGEFSFRLVITERGYVGSCTAQRQSLCLFYGFYGKGLGEKEQLSLLDDGAVLFHSLLCFPFFHSFVVGFFGRTRWVLGREFSSLGGFILV